MTLVEQIRERAYAALRQKYVVRSDSRQKSMGLSYVEAETRDLSEFIATFALNVWRPIGLMTNEEKYSGCWLLHGLDLVDLDFNPEGVERGHWQDGEGWRVPGWDANSDVWTEGRTIQPTHYAPVPRGPHSDKDPYHDGTTTDDKGSSATSG